MDEDFGKTTNYFVNFPVTTAIPLGGKIVIKFPEGFDSESILDDSSYEYDSEQDILYKITGIEDGPTLVRKYRLHIREQDDNTKPILQND